MMFQLLQLFSNDLSQYSLLLVYFPLNGYIPLFPFQVYPCCLPDQWSFMELAENISAKNFLRNDDDRSNEDFMDQGSGKFH